MGVVRMKQLDSSVPGMSYKPLVIIVTVIKFMLCIIYDTKFCQCCISSF